MTAEARSALMALRAEAKFRPHLLSGYTGADGSEDLAPLNSAVNTLVDQALRFSDGPLSEGDILPLVEAAVHEVDIFATEDRERAYRYFDQVWAILGFSGDVIRKIP